MKINNSKSPWRKFKNSKFFPKDKQPYMPTKILFTRSQIKNGIANFHYGISVGGISPKRHRSLIEFNTRRGDM